LALRGVRVGDGGRVGGGGVDGLGVRGCVGGRKEKRRSTPYSKTAGGPGSRPALCAPPASAVPPPSRVPRGQGDSTSRGHRDGKAPAFPASAVPGLAQQRRRCPGLIGYAEEIRKLGTLERVRTPSYSRNFGERVSGIRSRRQGGDPTVSSQPVMAHAQPGGRGMG
jgi:hypothetical protein